jgi:eukaryotic-like serine/threonine-protein kinase
VTGEDDTARDGESPALHAFIEKAVPAAGLEAHRSLATLEARLFGRATRTVTVGRYVLADRIASGGGGTVYRARDPELDRDVAVKLLHAGHDANRPEGRARLVREAQLLSRIAHPNIIEIHDVGAYDSGALGRVLGTDGEEGIFIAMQYVEGSNLAAWLAGGPRDWTEIRDVFVAAGRGLAAAHAAGLVHRDFKPANVLVGRSTNGTPDVRVLDFGLGRATAAAATGPHAGIAAPLANELERLGRFDMSLTMTGALLGTPAYMAPEQHAGERADARSDQYSFCLAMYEGLCGCSPFVAGTAEELETAKRDGEILPAPASARIPPHVEAALRRGLAPNPAERWPDMERLLEALEQPAPQRRAGRSSMAALVTAAVAATATIVWWPWSEACTYDLERVTDVWNPRRVDALREAFLRTERPFAAATFERAHARVEAYVEAWTAAVTEHCDAPRPKRSAEAYAIRGCFDGTLESLDATIAALCEADAERLDAAIEILAALPRVDACGGADSGASASDARRLLQIATALALQGRSEAALERLEEAHDQLVALPGPPHPLRIDVDLARRELLDGLRPSEDASIPIASTLALSEEVYGPAHPRTAEVRGRLAHALLRAGRHRDAAEVFEVTLRDLEGLPDEEHRIPTLRIGLGEARLASGHPQRALESFERAMQALEAAPTSTDLADARFGTARALRETGAVPPRATALAERARDTYVARGDRNAVARVEAWLSAD